MKAPVAYLPTGSCPLATNGMPFVVVVDHLGFFDCGVAKAPATRKAVPS